MKLNKSKYQILHVGREPGYRHKLEDKRLESSPLESDLVGGGEGEGKLNMSQQHGPEAKRANRVLGCIKHSIATPSREGIVPLYTVLV